MTKSLFENLDIFDPSYLYPSNVRGKEELEEIIEPKKTRL
jgi:hypothetical protein|tara:strand:- start:122 stop:241 length:120 start_codon:yes stop_codon:yes gene_type:complete